jgi:energy-converting hydrogenase Eha subunit A
MLILEYLAAVVGAVVIAAVYLAPMFVAFARNHPQRHAIRVLNLFGGWTIIGWIVAITWAHTRPPTPDRR